MNRLYPPRFTIEVYAKRAVIDTFLEVHFEGAVTELVTEIELKCRKFIVLCFIIASLVPKPSYQQGYDHLQYVKMEGGGLKGKRA